MLQICKGITIPGVLHVVCGLSCHRFIGKWGHFFPGSAEPGLVWLLL